MAKNISLKADQIAAGAFIALVGGNTVAAYLFNKPYLACWLEPVTSALYLGVATVILYAVSAFILYQLLRGAVSQVIVGALIFTLVVELPTLASKLFKLGVSCG